MKNNFTSILDNFDYFGDSYTECINKKNLIITLAKMDNKLINEYKLSNQKEIYNLKNELSISYKSKINTNFKIKLKHLYYNKIDLKYLKFMWNILGYKNIVITKHQIKVKLNNSIKYKNIKINKLLENYRHFINFENK